MAVEQVNGDMYLYVVKYHDYPDIVKIGISIDPKSRLSGLKLIHGKVEMLNVYQIGKHYKRLEKLIHVMFDEVNVPIEGDGGTEFFKTSCLNKVYQLIAACDGIDVTESYNTAEFKAKNFEHNKQIPQKNAESVQLCKEISKLKEKVTVLENVIDIKDSIIFQCNENIKQIESYTENQNIHIKWMMNQIDVLNETITSILRR